MGTIMRQRSLKVYQQDNYNAGNNFEVSSPTIQIFGAETMPQYYAFVRISDTVTPTKKKRNEHGRAYCAFQSFNTSAFGAKIGELNPNGASVNQFYEVTSIFISTQSYSTGGIQPMYCNPVMYTHLSAYAPYCLEELEDIILTPTNFSPSVFADAGKSNVFSWDYSRKDIVGEDGLERNQKSAVIEWKDPDRQVHTVNVSGESTTYTFPENTFPINSSFDWRIKIISDDDVESDFSSWITVSTTDVAGTVRALSPDIAIVDADVDNRFSWIYSNPCGTNQSGYEIEISSNGGMSWKQLKKAETADCFANIPAGTLPGGNVQYRVKAFSQSGLESEWAVANITVRKRPAPPSIYRIDGSVDKPTVYWESSDQEAYELTISDSSGRQIYSYYSPLADHTHKITKRLDNEQYTVSIRIWNEYGLESPEALRQFSVTADKPAKPTVSGTILSDHNHLELSFITSRAVLLRNGIAIADVSGLSSYDDYTAPVKSEYCLRALTDAAFCDSNPLTLECSKRRATIVLAEDHGVRVTLIYKQGSAPERSSSVSGEYGLMQFAGRKRPVAEYGDQILRTKSLSYSLRNENDLRILASMVGKAVIYNDRLDHMVACITSLSWNELRGYADVSFSLTEVDGSEEVDYE